MIHNSPSLYNTELQRRIGKGDEKAGTAVDPRVFLGVEERLAELQQTGQHQHEPYSDDSNRARAMPVPRGTGIESGKGGGIPTKAGDRDAEGGELLDFMSMDIGGGMGTRANVDGCVVWL